MSQPVTGKEAAVQPEPRTLDHAIDHVGGRGDGVAVVAGRPVYIPLALPGETWSRAADGAFSLASPPSPERVTPACPHYETCGGCVAQHMDAALYARWKRGLVVEAFRQRGLQPDVAPLVAVAPHSRRRAAFSARRTADAVVLGYHRRASHDLVDLESCLVLTPAIEAALPALRGICGEVLGKGAGQPAEARLSVTSARQGLDVTLTGAAPTIGAKARQAAMRLAEQTNIRRLIVDGEVLLAGPAPVVTLSGLDVELPDQSFLQAVADAELAMVRAVLAGVGDRLPKGAAIADLFCGLGTFTFALARKARVLAMDGDVAAIAALTAAARRAQGTKPIEARRRDLFREPLAVRELAAFAAVVLDPPRAGARAQCEALARSKVARVVMVSCDPGTMARDARTLVDGGFHLEAVTPIDQFLYSDHVEAVAVFAR